MKNKTKFTCSNCGAESLKWMGRCPNCGEWNTLIEQIDDADTKRVGHFRNNESSRPIRLSDLHLGGHERISLGISEVDRPLGGGLITGSVILWGGEPGIGKSTLILQICDALSCQGHTVLYCTGEESDTQIKMRAERLSINTDKCFVFAESSLDKVIMEIEKIHPSMVVIDSIQTMYLDENSSALGSPAQIRDCTAALVRLAKELNITVMIIGHVTKEGNLAGPRILEHMVDVVFYLEGERSYQFRVLRTVKNRFGSTSESGFFAMEGDGLRCIDDPSIYLLQGADGLNSPGRTIASCMEGLRPVLIEIQALSVHSVLSVPRRIASGYDFNRLIILLAVMEKKLKIPYSSDDVYLNVAGGYKIKETAADLSVALSLFSVKYDIPLRKTFMAFGEIGLTGEILPVSKLGLRLKEAVKMSFTEFLIPMRNKKEAEDFFNDHQYKVMPSHISFVTDISEAIEYLNKSR